MKKFYFCDAFVSSGRTCVAASVLRGVRLRASRIAGTPYGVMPYRLDDPLHVVDTGRGEIVFVGVCCATSPVLSSFLAV